VLLSARQASAVIAAVNALRAAPPSGRFSSCFVDPFAVAANLAYASGHSVKLYVETSNDCQYATNGSIVRDHPEKAIKRLVALLVHLSG
jgi:hypothetical protein